MLFSCVPTFRQKAAAFWTVVGLALVIWMPSLAHCTEEQNRSVIGRWKLIAVLDSSDITSMDEKEAERFVGKVLTIAKDKVQLGGRTCLPPNFEETREETYRYFREQANASAENLGLPNPVTAVHVSCTSVYIKSAKRLVVHWNGFFFDAVRLGTS